jgi:hypothetical protein
MRVRVSLVAVLAVLLATAACTVPNKLAPAPESSNTSTEPGLGSNLGCQDAWSGNATTSPDAPKVSGVSSLAWLGSPPNYKWPITDSTDGYPYTANGGTNYGAWKSPISIDQGTGGRVLTIDSPSDAAIIVASATKWESSQALRDGKLQLPDSYTVTACTDRPTQFPGMTLVRGPACVVIRVTDPATGSSSTISVPMYGATCP